jgi:hypothetical protein
MINVLLGAGVPLHYHHTSRAFTLTDSFDANI